MSSYLSFVMRNMSLMMTDPLKLVSDRNHLINEHMEIMRENEDVHPLAGQRHVKVRLTTTTSLCTAPNGSYPVIPLDPKNMITIKDILVPGPDVVHDGKFLLCRSILPPFRMNSLQMIVDDPNGERCLRVSLYNFSQTIQAGTILVIMHPWFKRTADMSASIRVENPMHVRTFDGNEALLRGITWKAPLPKESGVKEEKKKNPEADLALEGNRYFTDKNYPKAIEAYSKAIEAHPQVPILYSNRALGYLKIDKPLLALEDTETGLKMDPSNLKLLFRKGKALAMLKRFKESADFLDKTVRQHKEAAEQKCFKDLIRDVKRMQEEHTKGEYDVMKMLEEAKRSKLLENHADYYATTKYELKEIKGKGRGLVATERIPEGTLLMACKAFVFAEGSKRDFTMNINFGTGRMDNTSFTQMLERTCEKLSANPDLADDFYQLYAGENLGSLEKADKFNPVDIDRISGIMRFNTFGIEDFLNLASVTSEHFSDGGIWIQPSYFNHSCVDTNCFRFIVGDFMFIRAKKTIEPGEELLLEYVTPWDSYDERQKSFRSFGFKCHCRFCRAEEDLPKKVIERCKEIHKVMDDLRDRHNKSGSFEPSDLLLMKALLKESLQYLPDLGINGVAARVQKALSVAVLFTDPDYSSKLLEELFEARKNAGDMILALTCAKLLINSFLLTNKSELAKWTEQAKKLAKVMYGDERVLDLVQIF